MRTLCSAIWLIGVEREREREREEDEDPVQCLRGGGGECFVLCG